MPKLKPTHKSECKCTELYLIQHSSKFSDSIDYTLTALTTSYAYLEYYYEFAYEKYYSKCVNSLFNAYLAKCDLQKRFNICQIETISNKLPVDNDHLMYVYDWIKLGEVISLTFTNYINLIFSVASILINLFMIILLTDKKLMATKMYTHLLINIYFNLVYSVILTVHFVLQNSNDINLNGVKLSLYSQYIHLIIVKYIGNLVKTGTNISHISFTLCRYISITNKTNFIFDKFYKLNAIKTFFIILIFSILINLFTLFQFDIKSFDLNTVQLHSITASNYSNYYKQEPFEDYKENFSESAYLIMNILQYIKIIFSDLFYIIISIIIDLILVCFIKNKIGIRKQLVYMNPLANLIVSPFSTNIKQKKKKDMRASKERISQMIILNGINFLVFRFPLAIYSFYGFVFRYNRIEMRYEPNLVMYIVCKARHFCASLREILLCFYLTSFAFQFFIFYKLDGNFKESFFKLKNSVFTVISCKQVQVLN